MKLIIHAPNVHRGGGKVLLLDLIDACRHRPVDCLAFVDDRLGLPELPQHIKVIPCPPTVTGRITAELELRDQAQRDDVVLCMGNLPPLFRLRSRRTILFLQNRYVLDAISTASFPASVRIRTVIERYWLRMRARNAQQIVVQSLSMANSVKNRLAITPVIAPFATGNFRKSMRVTMDLPDTTLVTEAVFIYVASGESHKNHQRLIEAWKLLAEAGLLPLLRLTLNPVHHKELVAWIEGCRKESGLRIENIGEIGPEQLSRMYSESSALIYPSLTESLGLPLLEARSHGLPIIASERDFVRDAVVPQYTFDPESALSISRAVRRFLGAAEQQMKIWSATEFLDMVSGK